MATNLVRSCAVLLLAQLALAATAQNIVQDPGFESAAAGTYTEGQTFDGFWTVRSSPFAAASVVAGNGFAFPTSSVALGSGSAVVQSLQTATGQLYEVGVDVKGYDVFGGNPFSVDFGGETRTGGIVIRGSGVDTIRFAFLATATSGATSLTLTAPDVTISFDNVSVQAVPEPTTMVVLSLGVFSLRRRHKLASWRE